eukprot:12017792-Ditylum_brightwellii.AAC.1
MKKTIKTLKSELHEIRHEFNISGGVALSPVSPARFDISSFAKVSFDATLVDMDEDNFKYEGKESVGC